MRLTPKNISCLTRRLAGLLCVTCLWPLPVAAQDVEVRICFDYACAHQAEARFDAATMASVAQLFEGVSDAADERLRLAHGVAQLYLAASLQTPIWRDRGGNRNDDNTVPGAMDCIDHSTNTTQFLRLMARAGMLQFHQVEQPVRRVRWLVAEHWSARVVESVTGNEYAIDSWFYDLGTPAVVMRLADWRDGAPPVPPPLLPPVPPSVFLQAAWQ